MEYNQQEIINRQEELFRRDLYQELIEFIPDPCFLMLKDKDDMIIVNQSLVNLLLYSSTAEFYNNQLNINNILNNKEIQKIRRDFDIVRKSRSIKFRKYNIVRKDGTSFSSIICIKPLIESSYGNLYGYLGTINENEKYGAYEVDKSILHIFNDDRFPDEAIVVLDFKGNILASNKKFYMIDFFADFSSKQLNLFNSIDKSYSNLLTRRIQQLKKGIPTSPTEYKLSAENEKTAYIEAYSKTAIYKNKKVIVTLLRDITVRKEIEKKLLYAIVQTDEKERHRFAQDLHDELGPFLSGLKMYLHELNAHDTDSERRKILIDYLGQMIDEAVDKIRTLSSSLMPQNMIEIGLSASIERLIDKLNHTGRININLKTEGSEVGIEKTFIIILYRIVLELINNSIKHSGSDKVLITMIFEKNLARLNYQDNGIGFDLEKSISKNYGIGLRSILNRVELFNGSYKFTNIQPNGIEFDFSFPLR